jgi:hypothetical protein
MKFGSPPLIRQGSFLNPLPPKDLVHQITSDRTFTFTYICQGSKPRAFVILCSSSYFQLGPDAYRVILTLFRICQALALAPCVKVLLALAQRL